MVDLSKAEDLNVWLASIGPDARRREVAIVIAVRAALRVTPLILSGSVVSHQVLNSRLGRNLLPALRGAVLTWVAAKYPTQGSGLRQAAELVSGAIYAKVRSNDVTVATVDVADIVLHATGSAVSTAAIALDTTNADELFANQLYYTLVLAANAVAHHIDNGIDPIVAANLDAAYIEAAHSAEELIGEPLWINGTPAWAIESWQQLRSALLTENDDWVVWTAWYEARLVGDVVRQPNEALEVARATMREWIWTHGPRTLNAEVAALIELHTPKPTRGLTPGIPATKPAALQPEFDASGRLVLLASPAKSSLEDTALVGALATLSDALKSLAEATANENNIDRRLAQRLREISDRVPHRRPNDAELFALGHSYEEFKSFEPSVAETWPTTLAARFTATVLTFDRIMRRFPKWLDFIGAPRIEKLDAAQALEISVVAHATSEALQNAEIRDLVDQRLPEILDAMSDRLSQLAKRAQEFPDPIDFDAELLARDLLESLNNILKRIAERGLAALSRVGGAVSFVGDKVGDYGKAFAREADDSLMNSSREAGKKVGPAVVNLLKWTLSAPVVLASAGYASTSVPAWLSAHYPSMFSWLDSIVKLIEHLPK